MENRLSQGTEELVNSLTGEDLNFLAALPTKLWHLNMMEYLKPRVKLGTLTGKKIEALGEGIRQRINETVGSN
jgi:hypothetical protein